MQENLNEEVMQTETEEANVETAEETKKILTTIVCIDYYGKSIIAHREGALPVVFNSDGTILFSNN